MAREREEQLVRAEQFPPIIFSSRSLLGQRKKSVLCKSSGSVKPLETPGGEDFWEPSLVQGHTLGVPFALNVKAQPQLQKPQLVGGGGLLPPSQSWGTLL